MDGFSMDKKTRVLCNFLVRTYVKTKNREVEPTRRQAAVHTGMKALGFSESAPLVGILSSPHSSVSHTNEPDSTHAPEKCSFVCECSRTNPFINLTALENENHSRTGKKEKAGNQTARSSLLTPASRPVCPGRQQRTDAASGLSQRWSFYS